MENKSGVTRLVVAVVIGLILMVAIALVLNKKGSDQPTTNTAQSSSTANNSEETDTQTTTKTVEISSSAFSPISLSIKAGTTVTWVNNDDVAHTVTADTASSDAPNSPQFAKGESYTYTFDKAGTYDYHCNLHSGMTGIIIVTD